MRRQVSTCLSMILNVSIILEVPKALLADCLVDTLLHDEPSLDLAYVGIDTTSA